MNSLRQSLDKFKSIKEQFSKLEVRAKVSQPLRIESCEPSTRTKTIFTTCKRQSKEVRFQQDYAQTKPEQNKQFWIQSRSRIISDIDKLLGEKQRLLLQIQNEIHKQNRRPNNNSSNMLSLRQQIKSKNKQFLSATIKSKKFK